MWDDLNQVDVGPTLGVGSQITDGDYYVKVHNDGYGDVAFIADTSRNPAGVVPVFTFRDNLESVTIIDRSDQEMNIVGIDMIYRDPVTA